MADVFYAGQADYIAKLNEMGVVQTTITNSYYGPFAADPTLRPDGTAIQTGDRYFNTVSSAEKIFNGTIWYTPSLNTATLATSAGAATVGTTPAGGLSATTVQAALNELDSEKQGTAALLDPDGVLLVGNAADKRDLAAASGAGLVGANAYQTQDGKNAERYSILGAGAIGDGVTNNLTAITAAIAAANGRTIYVPVDVLGGNYAITSGTLTIPSTARFEYEAGSRIYASGGVITDAGRHFKAMAAGAMGSGQPWGLSMDMSTPLVGTATGSDAKINRIRIWDDQMDYAGKVDGLLVQHVFGGAGAKGGRHAVEVVLQQTSATSATNPDRNYVAVVGKVSTTSGDAVADGGSYFGGDFYVTLSAGATGCHNATGLLAEVGIDAGASAQNREGVQVTGHGAVRGSAKDSAISVSASAGSVSWARGIYFNAESGGNCFDATSSVIEIDASPFGYFLKSPRLNIAPGYFENTGSSSYLALGYGAASNSPSVRFKTGATPAPTYDSRFVASGGNGADGGGTITANAALMSFSGTIRPGADNTLACGAASYRWSVVYAGTGAINTSDEREKQQIAPIDDAAIRAVKKVDFKQFKFNDAVSDKGSNARWHFGVIAQQVKTAFESEGLNPFEYGVLCFDEWQDEWESWPDEYVDEPATYFTVLDEQGKQVEKTPSWTRLVKAAGKILTIAAGNRYGVRYEELLCLKMAALS